MSDVTYSFGGWQCAECAFRVTSMPKAPDSDFCLCSICGHTGSNEEFLAEFGTIFGRRQIRFMKRLGWGIIIAIGLTAACMLWRPA